MASASRDLTENADDNGTSQVIVNCLATSVVLRRILRHFSSTKLLTLSLVSKQWNYEARCLIRDRGNSIANLTYSSRDLAELATDLQQMNVVPFSGMRISLHGIDSPWSLVTRSYDPPPVFSLEALAPIHNVILNRLPLKYFHVTIEQGFWERYEQNPRFVFVWKAFCYFSRVFEDFAINNYSGRRRNFEEILQHCFFPKLKFFRFVAPDQVYCDFTNFFKMMVSRAPNLQELHTDWLFLMENVLEGTSAVLVPISGFNPLDEEFPEFFTDMVRLKSLCLVQRDPDFSVRRFNKIIPLLLQASRTSITSVRIDTVFALPVMCYGICLENVTELVIHMDWSSLELVGPCVLMQKAFDFTSMFPKLEHVTVHNFTIELELNDVRKFVRQANATLKQPMPNRAANIYQLSLTDCFNGCTAAIHAAMFPNIKSLFLESSKEEEIPCGYIWNHWPDLKEITIQKTSWNEDVPRIGNLDSVFCGIFPEEVAELRGKDDEYLKCVNIVPIAPSITSLKQLKRFKFVFRSMKILGETNDGSTSATGDFVDPTFVFSRVTGLIIFARCPYLAVTLETNSAHMENALSHMKPYASVFLTR